MRHDPQKVTRLLLTFLLTGCFATSSSLPSSNSQPSSNTSQISTTSSTTSISSQTTSSQSSSEVVSSESTPLMVTISFVENGGSTVPDISLAAGSTFDEPTEPTREDYVFVGWFSDAALTQAYVFNVVPNQNLTLYAKWVHVTEYNAISITDFKSLPLNTYGEVVGVVLFALSEMQLVVLADAENTLAVMSNEPLNLGDWVRMGGIRQDYQGCAVMMDAEENAEDVFLNQYGVNHSIPLGPVSYSLAEFFSLDAEDPDHWMQYIQLTGTFVLGDQFIGLQSGELEIPIIAPTLIESDVETLMMYVGLEVKIDGIILPNGDETPMQLMFIYIGGEDHISYNYSDQALLTVMLEFLKAYLESTTYYPGQVIDLPDSHPVLLMPVTYEAIGEHASLIDLQTGSISATIETSLTITLLATGQYLTYTDTIEINLVVVPIETISIAAFRLLEEDYETFYFLEGVIVFMMLENGAVLLADETGLVFVITNRTDLLMGDRILVRGFKMTTEDDMVIVANDPSLTVIEIKEHNQSMPLIPTPMTVLEFTQLDVNDPTNSWQYISLTAMLMYDETNTMFYLTNGQENIPISPVDASAANALMALINSEIELRGISLRPGEETFLIIIFLNLEGDLNLIQT